MLRQLTNIKKLFLLGIAVVSTKVVLLLFAYFFDSETYNQFNQVYYTASIVILFGSLGFNIAITRVSLSMRLVAVAAFINIIIAYFFLQITSEPFVGTFQITSIILYAFFSSLAGIYVFHLLFTGNYKDYVKLTILYSVLHLLIIPSILFLDADLFLILPCISFLWFIIGYPKYIKQKGKTVTDFKEFYKVGLSAFIINSAVSLALAADKYFVNHYFSMEIANSYTFAWGLTAPMFYIGVIIEQFLFSELNASKANILKRGLYFSSSLVIIYAIVLLAVVYLFPALLPASVNYNFVVNILTLMISGYSLYIIIHFPVNAYLFKSLSTEKQKTISVVFAVVISGFLVIYIFIFQEIISINYIWLLIFTWSYIFTLLITKIFIMFRKTAEEEPLKQIMEITGLEP